MGFPGARGEVFAGWIDKQGTFDRIPTSLIHRVAKESRDHPGKGRKRTLSPTDQER